MKTRNMNEDKQYELSAIANNLASILNAEKTAKGNTLEGTNDLVKRHCIRLLLKAWRSQRYTKQGTAEATRADFNVSTVEQAVYLYINIKGVAFYEYKKVYDEAMGLLAL